MLLLPKTVGPFTLVRKLEAGGVAESYQGTLDTQGGRNVVVRRILPYILRDAARLASTEARVRDLLGVRHPFLVQVLDWVVDGEERFIVEEWVDGIDLERMLAWCRSHGHPLPHNVFLNLATQVCNGLEALHGRPGKGTGSDNVLHLGLKPGSVVLTSDGKVLLGGYGLSRSPTSLPHGGVAGPVPTRMEYLSPEQTHSDQKLTPASDIFSLGGILYELLTLDPLFRSDSNLQTIHKIRRAEVTTQLLRVKEIMPGLDKLLYRALSLNPRHRYQRAFVLREDLRGLMAGYSFNTIVDDTRAFIAPLFQGGEAAEAAARAAPPATSPTLVHDAPDGVDAFDDPTRISPNPASTAAYAAQALAERVARESEAPPPDLLIDDHDNVSSPPPSPPDIAMLGMASGHADRTEGIDSTVGIEPTEGFGFAGEAPPPPVVPATVPATDARPADLAPPIDAATYRALARQGDGEPSPDSTRGFLRSQEPNPPATSPPTLMPASDMAVPDPAAAPSVSIPVDPNSTRGFLRGHDPEPSAPPSASPRADRSQGFTRWVPPPLTRPEPPAAAQPPPQTPPAVAAPQPAPTPVVPAAPQVAQPAPVAAPRPPAAPAPRPAPPVPPADDDDLDWKPRRTGGLLFAASVAIALLAMLVCAGGVYLGFGSFSLWNSGPDLASTDAAPAAAEPAVEPPAPADGEASADATLAEDEADIAPAEPDVGEPDADDDAVAAAQPEPGPSAPPARSSYEPPARAAPSYSGASVAQSSTGGREKTSYSGGSASSARSASPASSYAPRSDAIADASLDEPEDLGEPTLEHTDVDQYAAAATSGRLTSSDMMSLEMVSIDDRSYTRSRTLLLMDAQKKGDATATKKYLDELMRLPENRYSPVFLTDLARWHVNRRDYQNALDNAVLAERYWARLPSELVFTKKAEIYEIQAAACQGLFYASNDNMELLEQAIRHWEKYRNHAQTRSRSDLSKRADQELAKLEDIRVRLQ